VSYESYQVVGDPVAGGPFVFTCEHAAYLLPEWTAESTDLPLLEDHWGWDVGAADLTRSLIELTASCGVLSRFSRLVCDPNRDASEESFVVEQVEGHALSFNRGLDAAERRRRQQRYSDPYHDAIDRTIRARKAVGTPVRLCSIHWACSSTRTTSTPGVSREPSPSGASRRPSTLPTPVGTA